MKLEQYKKEAHEFQGLASTLVRQLAFGGIALIWIFKIDKPIEHLLPNECYWPLLLFVLALSFDFLQYFVPSIIWIIFFRYHEKKNSGNVDVELKAKEIYSIPGYCFYLGKVILIFFGYIFIIKFLLCKL